MLHRLKDTIGFGLLTQDDDIGKVKDFLMDDRSWAIRYMSIDTSRWLPLSRKVLISPISFQRFDMEKERISVALSSEQVKQSPSIDEHKPVSREYEELLFTYFGYGYYWIGPGVWGDYAQPTHLVDELDESQLDKELDEQDKPVNHLRSFQELLDYKVQCADDMVGHVADFVLNEETWQIEYVIVDSRNWLVTEHHYKVPIKHIKQVDWGDRTMQCELSIEQVQDTEIV